MNEFTLRIDTSNCRFPVGYDTRREDWWRYSDLTFRCGKLYGLVSEYGQGCEYVSYLLGGRVDLGDIRIFRDDRPLSQNDLREMSWNLEPAEEPYGKRKAGASIRQALAAVSPNGQQQEAFASVANRFQLTPERYDRRFVELSGERWRAAAALGYAQQKQIFFAPYRPSIFYAQMCRQGLVQALRQLTDSGAVVVLPTGSDTFLRQIADEVVYLDPSFENDAEQEAYCRG